MQSKGYKFLLQFPVCDTIVEYILNKLNEGKSISCENLYSICKYIQDSNSDCAAKVREKVAEICAAKAQNSTNADTRFGCTLILELIDKGGI